MHYNKSLLVIGENEVKGRATELSVLGGMELRPRKDRSLSLCLIRLP